MNIKSPWECLLITLLLWPLSSCASVSAKERELTADMLNGAAEFRRPLRTSEFAMPPGAQTAMAEFTGVLRLVEPERRGQIRAVHDPFRLAQARADAIGYLPGFEFAFVQRGSDLIPLQRGVVRTGHPYWEYVLQPGKVWHEPGDTRWSRASLPFSLQERSANCTHNGLMTWLFDADGNVSRVAYQIGSETCAYFKADLWGIVPATFEKREVPGSDEAIRRLDSHRAARLPVKPVASLADDHPGVNPANLGAVNGARAEDMTVYGLVVDGVHYRGGCDTRHGPYPYCDSLALPSYSTAKSIFAGFALMRMEGRHPGIAARSVSSLVPECAEARWRDVSLENLLDMATGNFKETGWEVDEGSELHVEFIDDDTHATKLAFACDHFERRAKPGSLWVYHTSDTYLLGTALNNYVKERHESGVDLYEHVIVEPILKKLNLSPLLDDTKRTYDSAAQAFAGYGLTYEADDIARIAHWFSSGATLDDEPLFDAAMRAAALQRDASDIGLQAVFPSLRYNNGFWGFNAGPSLGCADDVWVPFMSGYGGITVAMFPNDIVYYYFSDGYVHKWASAAIESSKIRNLCP